MASGDIIRLGGAGEWSQKTYGATAPTTTALPNSILNITGAGVLIGISNFNNITMSYAIQVDGGTIKKFPVYSDYATLLIPFKASLVITSDYANGIYGNVEYVLD